MTQQPEMDELTELALADLPESIKFEADPAYVARLADDLRARHARTTHRLGWFDMDLPVGQIRLIHDGRLVHFISNSPGMFEQTTHARLGFEPPEQPAPNIERGVKLALAGRRRGSDVAYLGELPAFQRRILEVTATIPRGEVRPYGWVARQAGNAAAVRAAGTALGHNPVPFVVPCHRVVRSDWTLGQYSAGGPEVKDRILRWEGCDVAHIEQLAANARFFSRPGSGAFCLPACRTLSGTNAAELIAFRDAPSALAAGYIACDDCRPA